MKYPGNELEIFDKATIWRKYIYSLTKNYLKDNILEIGAGLGEHAGKVWRIGLMGYACKPRNIDHCLAALRTVLK